MLRSYANDGLRSNVEDAYVPFRGEFQPLDVYKQQNVTRDLNSSVSNHGHSRRGIDR